MTGSSASAHALRAALVAVAFCAISAQGQRPSRPTVSRLNWQGLAAGMSEEAFIAGAGELGFKMQATSSADSENGVRSFSGKRPDLGYNNCIPQGERSCESLSVISAVDPTTKRGTILGFSYDDWLPQPALALKVIEPALKKYGQAAPQLERAPSGIIPAVEWVYQWNDTAGAERQVLRLRLRTFSQGEEPGSTDTVYRVRVEVSDPSLNERRQGGIEQQRRSAPPPVKF